MKCRVSTFLVGVLASVIGICGHAFASQRRTAEIPYLTTGLKCPAENSEILEQLETDDDGYVRRRRYKVVNNSIKRIIVESAAPGKGFEVNRLFDLDASTDELNAAAGRNESKNGQMWLKYICSNSERIKDLKHKAILNGQEISRVRSGAVEKYDLDISRAAPHSSFRTVGLRCPKNNGGILESVRRTKFGYTGRARYWVVDGNVKYIFNEVAKDGRDFMPIGVFDLDNPSNSQNEKIGKEVASEARAIIHGVCEDSEQLKQFGDQIKRNLNDLPPTSKLPDWDRTLTDIR